MLLTFRYRLLPTKGQHKRLRSALDHTRDLYNAGLESRIAAYRKAGKSVSFNDHCRDLTELRRDPEWAVYSVSLQRYPLKQLDLAFKAFFRRVRSSAPRSGYPRFKGREWFKTFGFSDEYGWSVVGHRLRMKGIGSVRIHVHREMPGAPISCRISRNGKHWYALLTVEVACTDTRAERPEVGIDVGIVHLATLSTGEHVANPRHAARVWRKMRVTQRALARCKHGSRNRRKAKARLASVHAKVVNARTTYLHQVSARIAREFGELCVEKLSLSNMTRSVSGVGAAAKAGLNREIAGASFGRLKEMLRYKAERAGSKFIEVDPRYSSQTCAACGVVDRASRQSQSRFVCTGCGREENADVNAAQIIALRGGVAAPGVVNVVRQGERRRGKIASRQDATTALEGK